MRTHGQDMPKDLYLEHNVIVITNTYLSYPGRAPKTTTRLNIQIDFSTQA
jgi:hypothetical protein